MLTPSQATELLSKCPICSDIQTKILMLFIGTNGTHTSNIIKSQICSSNDDLHNGSLVEKIISNNNNTLWSLKVLLNNNILFKFLRTKNLRTIYELQIAYLTTGNRYVYMHRQTHINGLIQAIKTNMDSDLFGMFYNLDKDKYKYLGTPTANIIHQAIDDNIINEFDPIIWYPMRLYQVDSDNEYF